MQQKINMKIKKMDMNYLVNELDLIPKKILDYINNINRFNKNTDNQILNLGSVIDDLKTQTDDSQTRSDNRLIDTFKKKVNEFE